MSKKTVSVTSASDFLKRPSSMPKFCTVFGCTLVERGWNAAALAIRSESLSMLSTRTAWNAAAARGYYVVDGYATTTADEQKKPGTQSRDPAGELGSFWRASVFTGR